MNKNGNKMLDRLTDWGGGARTLPSPRLYSNAFRGPTYVLVQFLKQVRALISSQRLYWTLIWRQYLCFIGTG